jgi:hypothetical protein
MIISAMAMIVFSPVTASEYVQNKTETGDQPNHLVNVPFASVTAQDPYPTQMAVFWFGKVDPTNNYADVRTIYNEERLTVVLHIIDRLIWYDRSPSPETLADWDAVTLYISLDGSTGTSPSQRTHRFVAQFNNNKSRQNYQAAYQGDGSEWILADTNFETSTGWRGGYNDDKESRGWYVRFSIPFSSLGLSQPPSAGTTWGLGLVVHDRDDASGTFIPDTTWPDALNTAVPSTWGQMVFGLPSHSRGDLIPWSSSTIRHGLNDVTVVDAHVGGHSTCGKDAHPNYFEDWGNLNYAGFGQINIQNQWDIADWPCFSKFYITFPLDTLPAGKSVYSANLTLHQFGNAWGGKVEPSFIQVLTVSEDWGEATITWNNAPLAKENISGTWVEPISFPGWPGVPRTWDISLAVAQVYGSGEPLRLVLYSADGAYHSGRYFTSSDTGNWNAVGRPTLNIIWGVPRDYEGVNLLYLPSINRMD